MRLMAGAKNSSLRERRRVCSAAERREVCFARVAGMEAGGMAVGGGGVEAGMEAVGAGGMEAVGAAGADLLLLLLLFFGGRGGAERGRMAVVEGLEEEEEVEAEGSMGGRAAEGGRAERSPSIWMEGWGVWWRKIERGGKVG